MGLDDVPWSSLNHHYGSAEDVPGLLRDHLDPDVWEPASRTLDNHLLHQGGMVPDAATAAVPFLVELAESEKVPIGARVQAISLVGRIAGAAQAVAPRWCDPGCLPVMRAWLPRVVGRLDDDADAVCRAAVQALQGFGALAIGALAAMRRRYAVEELPHERLRVIAAVAAVCGAGVGDGASTGRAEALRWLRMLSGDTQPEVRIAAVVGIRAVVPGAEASDTLDAILLEALRAPALDLWAPDHTGAPDWAVVGWTTACDGRVEAQLRPARELVGAGDRRLREGALRTAGLVLSEWRAHDGEVLELAAGRLRDPDPELRCRAALLVGAVGGAEATPYAGRIAAAAHDADHETAANALWALTRIGDPRCVALLAAHAADGTFPWARHVSSVSLRGHFSFFGSPSIGEVLAEAAPFAEALVPTVRTVLAARRDDAARRAMCEGLLAWGPVAAPAVPDLAAMIGSRAGGVAARVLGGLGDAALGAGPVLREVAGNPGHVNRWEAAVALSRITRDASPAIAAWREIRKAADMSRRVFDLGALGASAAELAREVREIVRYSGSERERVGAALTLWRVAGDPAGVGELVEACESLVHGTGAPVWSVEALRGLGEFGAEGRPAEVVLRELAGSTRAFGRSAGWRGIVNDRLVRVLAAEALERMG